MVMYTIREIIDKRISIRPCREELYDKIVEAYRKETGYEHKFPYNPHKFIRLYPIINPYVSKGYGYSYYNYLEHKYDYARSTRETTASYISGITEINLPKENLVGKIIEILFSIWEDADYSLTSGSMFIQFKDINKILEITQPESGEGINVGFKDDDCVKKLFLRDIGEVEKYLREIITRLHYFNNHPEGFMREVITVDYDNCFDKNLNVVNYVRFKMLCGYDCFILTYRFDELNKYRYKRSPTNDDLWDNVKGFFPDRKVLFMNSKLKGEYLAYAQNVVEHIDDSMDEINSIRRYAPHVKRIWVDNSGNLNDMMSLYNKGQTIPTIINLS